MAKKSGRYYEKKARRNVKFTNRRRFKRLNFKNSQSAPTILVKIILEEKTND